MTKMSPLLKSKSQIGSFKYRKIKHTLTHTQHTHTLVLFNPSRPVLIYGKGGRFRHRFQSPVPPRRSAPLVSHHPSAGAGVEDDTQLGQSKTQRLCFLSNTPLRSLYNSTTFPCILLCSESDLLCLFVIWPFFLKQLPCVISLSANFII